MADTTIMNAAVNAATTRAQQQPTIASQRRQINTTDWRVRLRLAPQSDYLYNSAEPGILYPLKDTDGIIFPYTPTIQTGYRANYTQYDLVHSNYKGYFYQNSYVEPVNITCTFTAQDTSEANYLLAVIHFFRSVTKMFYGQDVQRGSPPPVVFLSGLGEYQFNEHSCLVGSFSYQLPNDVDYIRAGSSLQNGQNLQNQKTKKTSTTTNYSSKSQRLISSGLTNGAMLAAPPPPTALINNPTYVPTRMDITIELLPIQSRNQISQQFSLAGFANGNLLKGGFW